MPERKSHFKKGGKGGFEFGSSRNHHLHFFNELQLHYTSFVSLITYIQI